MKKQQVGVVIIGAGFFGSKRLAACLSMPETFRIVAVVDPSETQRTFIADTYHVPVISSLKALKDTADLAIVATPNAYHVTACMDAMRHGMHVLCEKPLATTIRDARRISAAARTYGKTVKTGSNHRFFHTVQKAKELFDRGTIGKLLLFKGSIGSNGDRVSNKWFWDKNVSGGGTFIDNGCHIIDIARMFMGDFAKVTASMETSLWKKSGVEDMGTAIYLTGDNRQAVITSSWFQWAGYLHIELWGESGYILIDSTTHDTVTVGGKDGMFTTYDYSREPKDSYHRELLYMAGCIRSGKPVTPDASDGAAVIGMIDAAYRSSDKHIWIPIK